MTNLTTESLIRRADLFTLKLFLTAIEEGQIGRAAFREHLVPSAATRRFQDLEDLIGMKLFDRSSRGVVPTPAGQMVARHVRTILAGLEDLRLGVAEMCEGVRGEITVAAPGIMVAQFLAAEIGEFARRFPLVEVHLYNDQNAAVLRALHDGEVDFAVFSYVEGAVYEGIECIACRDDRLVLIVPVGHPLAQCSSVGLEELLDEDLISFGEGTTIMSQLRHAALAIGREPQVRYVASSVDAVTSLVRAGLGVALRPASIESADEQQRVRTLEVEGEWAERTYCIGYLKGKVLSPAAEAFITQMTLSSPYGLDAGEGADKPA